MSFRKVAGCLVSLLGWKFLEELHIWCPEMCKVRIYSCSDNFQSNAIAEWTVMFFKDLLISGPS
jgi:hypothetical protein